MFRMLICKLKSYELYGLDLLVQSKTPTDIWTGKFKFSKSDFIFTTYTFQVDPDELSPNMRLGLPDESKYDLDRLMYSPIDEKSDKKKVGKKNGFIKGKGSRRSMKLKVPTDRMEVGLLFDFKGGLYSRTSLEPHSLS